MLKKALDYVFGVITKNEEVQQFPQDFVTASMQWIRSWFLVDDPRLADKLADPLRSEDSKRTVVETKLEELIEDPKFKQELEGRLQLVDNYRAKVKNVVAGSQIEAGGNVAIGDKGSTNETGEYDEKNTVKNSAIKAGGDVKIGDDNYSGNQVHVTNNYFGNHSPGTGSTPHSGAPMPSSGGRAQIEAFIRDAKPDKALALFLAQPHLDEDLRNTLLLQSGRLNRLNKDINMGVVSNANAKTELARINVALLELAKELA